MTRVETKEEERQRLDSMADEIERLHSQGVSDDEIRRRLAQKWPDLSPFQIGQAIQWWVIDIAHRGKLADR